MSNAIPENAAAAANLFSALQEIEEVVDGKFRPAVHLDYPAWILDLLDDGSLKRVVILVHASTIFTDVGALSCTMLTTPDRRRALSPAADFVFYRASDGWRGASSREWIDLRTRLVAALEAAGMSFALRANNHQPHVAPMETSKPVYLPEFFTSITVEDLISDVPWLSVTSARQECFMAEGVMDYTYGSGRGVRTYTSIPFSPVVKVLMDRLNTSGRDVAGNPIVRRNYNVCFLNRYDDAGQHLGWHADDSPGMDHLHPIAVVSFGASREIWTRPNDHTGEIPSEWRTMLDHGSLFLMPPGFQRTHQHRIPKGDRKMGPRVSFTYRHYIAAATETQ